MLIYEKDNKLNINFENSVTENPDLSIGKSGDKTQILVDGQESGGGSGGLLFILDEGDDAYTSRCTAREILDAYDAGSNVVFKFVSENNGTPVQRGTLVWIEEIGTPTGSQYNFYNSSKGWINYESETVTDLSDPVIFKYFSD